jgi:2,4-dienoyl-CoA reductase (NADPH2)
MKNRQVFDIDVFMKQCSVDLNVDHRGGLIQGQLTSSAREVFLLQREASKVGAALGKTSGWVHRAGLQSK